MKKLKLKKPPKNTSRSKYVQPVAEDLETPVATLRYCSIVRPLYFPGSTVGRYKIQLEFDPKIPRHKAFLENLESIAEQNEVQHIGRITDTKTIMITFQGRDQPKVMAVPKGKKRPVAVEIDHDFPKGFECKVVCDLKIYMEKHTKALAFTFPPKKLVVYLDEENEYDLV